MRPRCFQAANGALTSAGSGRKLEWRRGKAASAAPALQGRIAVAATKA
jgi:hypothetical protein